MQDGRDEMRVSRPEFIINDIMVQLDLLMRVGSESWSDSCVECRIQLYTHCPLPPITLASHNHSLCSLLPGHSTATTTRGWRLSIKKEGGVQGGERKKSCTYKPELAGSQWPAYSSGEPLRTCCSPAAANHWNGQKRHRQVYSLNIFGGKVVTQETFVRNGREHRRLIKARWKTQISATRI